MNIFKGVWPGRIGWRSSAYSKGKNYLLTIGINAYKDWPELNNAVRDAEMIARVLEKKYDFILLNQSLSDNEATRDNMEQSLFDLSDDRLHLLNPEDRLLIYYTGHGHLDTNGRGYWVPVDAEKNRIATYLPNGRIRELIADIKCRHILLVTDACFAGSFFYKGQSKGAEYPFNPMIFLDRDSRWAFCSGRHDEMVMDGPEGGNSPFAKALIEQLEEINEPINISLLADEVTKKTQENYPGQIPEANPIQDARHKGGQFVFVPNGNKALIGTAAPKALINPYSISAAIGTMILSAILVVIIGRFYPPRIMPSPVLSKQDTFYLVEPGKKTVSPVQRPVFAKIKIVVMNKDSISENNRVFMEVGNKKFDLEFNSLRHYFAIELPVSFIGEQAIIYFGNKRSCYSKILLNKAYHQITPPSCAFY